jgi:hypothetical protein
MIANKEVTTATNQHATAKELLEAVFSEVRAAIFAKQRRSKHAFLQV